MTMLVLMMTLVIMAEVLQLVKMMRKQMVTMKVVLITCTGVSHMGNAVDGNDIYLAGGLSQNHGKCWPQAKSIGNIFKCCSVHHPR